MIFFGLETSCDETAAAIIKIPSKTSAHVPIQDRVQGPGDTPARPRILAHRLTTQNHQKTGGVVPQEAARQHMQCIDQLVRDTFQDAGLRVQDVDGMGITAGPGLVAGLLVGVQYGLGLALGSRKPLWPVHHLHAHGLMARMDYPVDFPFLLLLLSGGHCLLAVVRSPVQYEILGETMDDAAGECLDKVARSMGGPYPGGPWLEALAQKGHPEVVPLPIPLRHETSCRFSFSGLKTAALQWIQKNSFPNQATSCGDAALAWHQVFPEAAGNLAASLQKVVADTLCSRLEHALTTTGLKHCVISGGVAANTYFRNKFQKTCEIFGAQLTAPSPALCTDNGVMIAWAAWEYYNHGIEPSRQMEVRPRWPLGA
jgi:N6-L-threonylcarbamoyladenine synthase